MPGIQEPRNHERSKTRLAIFGLSVSLLALSVSILATSTYAWYKLADLLNVNGIEIGYSAGQSFKIGMKNPTTGLIEYPNYISMDEPQELTNSTLKSYSSFTGNEKLLPVSGMYQNLWFAPTPSETTLPLFRSSFFSSDDVREANPAARSSYLQFEFYFRSDRDVYLFLDQGTSLSANPSANAEIARAKKLSSNDLNAVERCARVSFYSSIGGASSYTIYEPNVSQSSNTLYSGRLNLTDDDPYFDYDKDGKEILFGEYAADHLVYSEAGRVSTLTGKETAFNALSDPTAQPLDLAASEKEGGLVLAQEKSYGLAELAKLDARDGHPLAYIPHDVDTRVVVSVYLEGWDHDTLESIVYAKFNLHLAFAGVYQSLIGGATA